MLFSLWDVVLMKWSFSIKEKSNPLELIYLHLSFQYIQYNRSKRSTIYLQPQDLIPSSSIWNLYYNMHTSKCLMCIQPNYIVYFRSSTLMFFSKLWQRLALKAGWEHCAQVSLKPSHVHRCTYNRKTRSHIQSLAFRVELELICILVWN